jgi:hypothetical protein
MDRREYIVSNGELEIRAENDGNGNPVYIGKAIVGSAEGDERWQISKQTYDGTDGLLTKKWPENDLGNASCDYIFSWTDRATYTYS